MPPTPFCPTTLILTVSRSVQCNPLSVKPPSSLFDVFQPLIRRSNLGTRFQLHPHRALRDLVIGPNRMNAFILFWVYSRRRRGTRMRSGRDHCLRLAFALKALIIITYCTHWTGRCRKTLFYHQAQSIQFNRSSMCGN
ncbi:hypothetical protein BT69DRAFT_49956 [Atractiella rhizophila]|nr:hypothetical protein BT69DRAFT_49956 [Atractiella rhizophila]